MNEIWKDIKGYEDKYQISNLGNVKTKKLIKKYQLNNSGYCLMGLYLYNKRKVFTIHRLVAEAFIPNPLNKKCVNHKNGIKTDNQVENLEWCTHKENGKHAVKNGLIKKGKDSPNYGKYDRFKSSSKKVNMLNKDGKILKTFNSIMEATRFLNKPGLASDIVKVCKTNRKSSNGYGWEYAE